jgi:hypothetical protein
MRPLEEWQEDALVTASGPFFNGKYAAIFSYGSFLPTTARLEILM